MFPAVMGDCFHGLRTGSAALLDSGASVHLFPDADLLHHVRPCRRALSGVSGGVVSSQVGDATVVLGDVGCTTRVDLRGVFHLPSCQVNLLSVAKLVDQGVEFVANKVRPSLRFPDGTVIPVTARKGLYIVPMSVAAPGGAAAIGTYQLPMSSSEARASATERDAWAQALATWEFDADALGGASAGADEVELLWQEDSDRAPPQELVPAPDFLPPGEAAFVSRELARARLGYISQRRRNLMIARGLTKG
ncbi:MAG: hypothetical protein AAGJ92_01565, partial [Pseudomonadota bacterium]